MKYSHIYLLLLTLTISCQDGMDTNPGDIEGIARLQKIFENNYNYDQIQVRLENGSDTYTALTDSSGAYSITDVETGTYRITFSKEGFNDHVIKSFLFYPAGIPVQIEQYIRLYEIPLVEISNDSLVMDQYSNFYELHVKGNLVELKGGHSYIRFRAFFSTDPDVDYRNFQYSKIFANIGRMSDNGLDISIYLNDMDYQFEPGSEVYVKCYPTSGIDVSYNTPVGYLHAEGYFVYTPMNQNVSTATHKFEWPMDMQTNN